MKHIFLKKNGNRSLLILFAGWGMDARPFCCPADWQTDVVLAYDYSDRDFENLDISGYETTLLAAWSFGVFAAGRWMAVSGFRPTRAIAINGTTVPIDRDSGIPPEIFNGTLDNLSETSLLKFYRRMCASAVHCDEFLRNRPERSLDSLRNELIAIRDEAAESPAVAATWDKAYIADCDRIIPTSSQKAFWTAADVPVTEIKTAHLPEHFFGLIRANIVDKQLIKRKFEKCWNTYDRFADCQKTIARQLFEKWKDTDNRPGGKIYEFGCGTGIFTKIYAPAFRPDYILLNDIARPPLSLSGQIACNHDFFIADAEYSLPAESFDRIVSASAVQWFENVPNFLKKIALRLSDDGLMVCSSFGKDNLKEMRQLANTSLNYLSVSDWRIALQQAGFSPVSVDSEEIRITFPSALSLLRSLKFTGVNGLHSLAAQPPKKLIRTIDETFPRTSDGQLYLTYNPIYILAHKDQKQ